jgi:dihydroorotate dehydrogenase
MSKNGVLESQPRRGAIHRARKTGSLMYDLVKPLLFQFDPERVHDAVMSVLKLASRNRATLELISKLCEPRDAKHGVKLWNLEFPNPVGLAAGFDKNALALHAWPALGFGFVEIGSVTAHGQPGNPKPRLFRLPDDDAIINRMGFNNDGARVVAARLELWRHEFGKLRVPLGINLGKSKITPLEDAPQDYVFSLEKLYEYGDYFVINVSSPNTPNLRELQDKDKLEVLLKTVMGFVKAQAQVKPVLLKIAPDLSLEQLDEILVLLEQFGLSGIIATNTTLARDGLNTRINESGGLSGRPLRARSLEILKHLSQQTDGRLPIISVGGISSAEDVQMRLDAGASLVQIYTGWIYNGPMMLREIVGHLKSLEVPLR